MPFEPLITAVIETSLNTLIKDDPALGRRLARLKGQVIQVHLKEIDKTLTFVFSQQIDVLGNYEGQPDCYLSLNLSVLPELRDQANITRLIKQDKLELEGDIQLAQKFSQLMTDCKPDIEEWLSRVTGDVVAHTLVQGTKNVGGFFVSQAENINVTLLKWSQKSGNWHPHHWKSRIFAIKWMRYAAKLLALKRVSMLY